MDRGAWRATVHKVAEADTADLLPELQQKHEESSNTQLPLLKGWEQKQGVGGKSMVLCVPPALHNRGMG